MKPINKTSPVRTRRKFDTTFKQEAVRNWLGSGKSAAVVAKERVPSASVRDGFPGVLQAEGR